MYTCSCCCGIGKWSLDRASCYINIFIMPAKVYNKEGGRVSYSSIVPCTAVVRVEARSMIFTMCGIFTVYTTSNCVADALSHNYTTHCEYH